MLDDRLRRPAQSRTIHLGETKVSYVPDGAVQGNPRLWLPDSTAETWSAHPEYLDDDGYLVASIGGLLVERDGRALLIDAGFGPQTVPAEPGAPNGVLYGGALLDNLAALGRKPEDVEAVALTHLHSDHIGWALRPAFAYAEYLVTEPEWAQRESDAMAPQVRTISDGQEVFPGVQVRFAAGHTPGHAEYVITDGGQRLIAFGDAVHSPIQIKNPDWSCVYDHDPVEAASHRRKLVAELAEPGTIGFGNHFADVVFGHVRDGRWQPLDR
ncbi:MULTISPECIES: MBL fold metallo-hydrolase [unclassified Amycolatopsis]|uniref:MBL fold metallo-hydrolase n=1 Tax=unclassified Amycolatopsis TaxID=2618356 RepID=UPI00196B8A2B|nr:MULTISPECIES: MBL fold metallo-hydrolase [unclassified Amycolatopsis]